MRQYLRYYHVPHITCARAGSGTTQDFSNSGRPLSQRRFTSRHQLPKATLVKIAGCFRLSAHMVLPSSGWQICEVDQGGMCRILLHHHHHHHLPYFNVSLRLLFATALLGAHIYSIYALPYSIPRLKKRTLILLISPLKTFGPYYL